MDRRQLLDLYFLEARSKLIDLAAFLDRMERAEGEGDFRVDTLMQALDHLKQSGGKRTERVLSTLSDPTTEPTPWVTTKATCGAWPGKS